MLIPDISPLFELENLERLSLEYNETSDLSFITAARYPNLESLALKGNNITDISALVDNSALGAGDFIDLNDNLLDLSAGSAAQADIDALIARGIEVIFEDQRTE